MIDPSKTWVISDTHFGHHNIIRFCDRPTNHEEIMVKYWNEVVPDDGVVLHLGDLFYGRQSRVEFARKAKFLHGTKLMLKGNHDKQKDSFYADCGFTIIEPFEMVIDGRRVSFSHYPADINPAMNSLHVHGHIHNNGYGPAGSRFVPFRARQINVSVEMTGYRSVLVDDLLGGYCE